MAPVVSWIDKSKRHSRPHRATVLTVACRNEYSGHFFPGCRIIATRPLSTCYPKPREHRLDREPLRLCGLNQADFCHTIGKLPLLFRKVRGEFELIKI
jgi:hypothetical protein